MKKGKEIKSQFLSMSPHLNYLPQKDKYLFDTGIPNYKFNVIGVGVNGQEHVRVTLMEGRAGINGVYDPNPLSVEGAKRAFKMFRPNEDLVVYDSLEAACNDPDVDGLVICTPNYTHLDVVKVAIKSGKHILLEKPMATTLEDAYELAQIANNYKAVFQIGLQYRYKAIYVEAIHEALERATLGEVKTISILEHRFPFLDKVNQWNKFSKYSGGTLVEKCCHYFDLMNLFAGARPVSVFGTGSQAVNFTEFEYDGEKSDIIDNAVVTVTYENGVRGSFDLCMFSPMFHEEMVVCGDEGRLKVTENQDFLSAPRPSCSMEIVCGEKRPSRFTTPTYPAHIEESGHHGATFYEHINFVDNIEGNKTNAATATEGLWSIVVGYAAEESVRTGKVITINEMLKEHGLDI